MYMECLFGCSSFANPNAARWQERNSKCCISQKFFPYIWQNSLKGPPRLTCLFHIWVIIPNKTTLWNSVIQFFVKLFPFDDHYINTVIPTNMRAPNISRIVSPFSYQAINWKDIPCGACSIIVYKIVRHHSVVRP